MHLSGVRPSVPAWATAAVARPAGDIDRLLHGAQQRRANAGSATLSAYVVAEHRLVNLL